MKQEDIISTIEAGVNWAFSEILIEGRMPDSEVKAMLECRLKDYIANKLHVHGFILDFKVFIYKTQGNFYSVGVTVFSYNMRPFEYELMYTREQKIVSEGEGVLLATQGFIDKCSWDSRLRDAPGTSKILECIHDALIKVNK